MSQNDKNPKTFQISKVLGTFPNFRQTSSTGTLKSVKKEKMCCPVWLEKRQMQFLKRKLSRMLIKVDKISKYFRFSLLLFHFCQNIDRLRGLDW